MEEKNIFDVIDIEYRNRKSLEIQIKQNGRVRVLVPQSAPEDWVRKAILSKENWINNKLEKVNESTIERPKLEHGSKVLDAGDLVELNIGNHNRIYPVERDKNFLYVQMIDEWSRDSEMVSKLLKDWYTDNTKRKIASNVEKWADILTLRPNAIRIKDQKRRWGSCSSKGNLNFNWRLSMAPDGVLEYVVVHELCHFYHMDHSKEFWNLVGIHIPDYKDKRAWLKEYGDQMFWLG